MLPLYGIHSTIMNWANNFGFASQMHDQMYHHYKERGREYPFQLTQCHCNSLLKSPKFISHGCRQVAKDSSCPLSHWHHRAPEGLSYPWWHSIHIDKLISPCRRSITLSPTLFGFSPLMYLYMEKTCIPRPKIFLRIHIMQLWEKKP